MWHRLGLRWPAHPYPSGYCRGATGPHAGWNCCKSGATGGYLLVDQCEALREFQELVELLDDRYVTLGIDEMVQPPETIDPTWT